MTGPPVEFRIANGDATEWHCSLIGIAFGRIHLYADHPITDETRVFVRFKTVTLDAIVRWCNPKDSGYNICLSVGAESEERRRESRLPIEWPAVIMSLGDSSITAECTLTDISRSGLRAELREPIAVGTMVCVETQATIIGGEVRNCREHPDRCEVGIQITDILTNPSASDSNIGIVEALRWKLAELIAGKRLTVARKLLR